VSALVALAAAIEKAGLIKPGKPSLLRRVGFLLSTGSNERNYKVGRYLEGRKAGKGFGPKGKRRARTGTYTGVYATGVNKSETQMSAIELLDEAIEKARKGLIPGGSKKMERRLFNQGAKGRYYGPLTSQRLSRASRYLGQRQGRVKKSSDATGGFDLLEKAIEKAKGLIVGGSRANYKRAVEATDSARRVRDITAGKSPSLSSKYGKLAVRRKRAEDYLRARTKRK
jgi:hypothetical protein